MYTEIVKIIEGGLAADREKVASFAEVLANSLEKQGEIALTKKIRSILRNKRGVLASLDSFSTRPVDTESRMDIVEISMPKVSSSQIVLSKYVAEEISRFVEFYESRDSLMRAGLEVSNSLLLYGPPGCGKTTLARYISTRTELPLVTARLDGLVSSLLGSTAKNIRKIFDYAEKRECILFLDEFDVLAKLRDDRNELGELKRVVNSLIQNIDSLNSSSIIVAATNHHELLDPAIWRRFSKVVLLEKPSKGAIGELIRVFLGGFQNTILDSVKQMNQLQTALEGFSHSEIKTVINNTVRSAIVRGQDTITLCEALREIYFHKNHSIEDERELISYLLLNNVTHKEINESTGISLRRIRAISKNVLRRDVR